jgi:hypothetical protein
MSLLELSMVYLQSQSIPHFYQQLLVASTIPWYQGTEVKKSIHGASIRICPLQPEVHNFQVNQVSSGCSSTKACLKSVKQKSL